MKLTGRQILVIGPDRHKAPQFAGFDHINGAAVDIGKVTHDPAPSQFCVPDIAMKGAHGFTNLGLFLTGFACDQHLPGLALGGQFIIAFRLFDSIQKALEVILQPLPLLIGQVGQAGIGRTVTLAAASEIDPAAHHAHTGPVAQDLVAIFGIQPADNRDAAGHELGKGITGAAQHPQLGIGKTRVGFGHGHAAGADVAAHKDTALGHGIGRTVGGMAMDDDISPGIQPAGVITGRTVHLDHSAREPHCADPLAGGALYPDMHRFVAGAPEPSADAMLAFGLHLDLAVSGADGRLHALFQHPGINSVLIFSS